MEKQTAGRNRLGAFAPKFAELNDDVLFGEVWAREDKLSLHEDVYKRQVQQPPIRLRGPGMRTEGVRR